MPLGPLAGETFAPAGRLREPLAAMSRANLIVFTRAETASGTLEAIRKLTNIRFSQRQRGCLVSAVSAERLPSSLPTNRRGPFFCILRSRQSGTLSSAIWGIGGLLFSVKPIFPRSSSLFPVGYCGRERGGEARKRERFCDDRKDAQNLTGLNFEEAPLYVAVIDLVVTPEADFKMSRSNTFLAGTSGGVKILIRATNWVGDAIMALPALLRYASVFRRGNRDCCAALRRGCLPRSRDLRSLIPYDPKALYAGLSGRETLALELRQHKFDTALLLQNAFDAAVAGLASEDSRAIGYARDRPPFLLTKAVPVPHNGRNPRA